MRQTLLVSVSALALSCTVAAPAQAAPPTPMTWTGFYVGANVGYAWGNSNPSLTGDPTALPYLLNTTFAAPPSLHPHGFIGGGQLGYNWQSGQWVYGVEVDFSGLSAKADATISPFFGFKGPNSVTWSSRYDWLFTSRVRGGMTVAPNWLIYATGGLAVTQVHDSVICTTPGVGCANFAGGWEFSKTSVLPGGTFGGGVETMFAPNWSARVEYLYAKFGSTTPGSSAGLPPLFSFNHSLSVARFAINYHFGP
jgi:outer membrane immunogenic protein